MSLAYLWQRDQKELVNEMIATELEAVVVKVAAMGLDERQIGKTLRQLYPYFLELVSIFCRTFC